MAFGRRTAAAAIAASALAAAGVAAFLAMRGPDAPKQGNDGPAGKRGLIEEKKPAAAAGQPAGKVVGKAGEGAKDGNGELLRKEANGRVLFVELSPDEKYEKLSKDEKKTYDSMQEISDENSISYRRVKKATEGALESENPTLRLKALETLLPFADEAVLDVVPLVVDADREVREAAVNLLEQGLQMMDDEKERISVVAKLADAGVMGVDTYRLCSSYIETMDDKIAALNVILPIMEKTKDKEMLKEMADSYESITGESFVDFDQAEKWAKGHLAEQAEEDGQAGQ